MQHDRILLVDDDVFQSQLRKLTLERSGFEVDVATSADEALQALNKAPFHLVITDVMMPGGEALPGIQTAGGFRTGIALACEIKKRHPLIKIIGLSGTLDQDVIEWFSQDPSMLFMPKPVDVPALIRGVTSLLTGQKPNPKVFIVHGRDRQLLLELKDFLQNRIGFTQLVLLGEQPSRGKTLIEKFEQYASNIDLVFVLFTPDDIGRLANSAEESLATFRPRLNVIFELGYFVGSIGRNTGRVFILHKGPLEMLSDLRGITYIDVSRGIASAAEEIRTELTEYL
jgi:CheY-like chemotaxis protein